MESRRALIGYTGFVGSTLDIGDRFTDRYNSKNFGDMADQRYGQVVCAGVSAAKWIANGDPEGDWAAIQRLIDVLEKAEIERFILISTIDVYPDPAAGGDEATVIDGDRNHAYGKNRLRLEHWARDRFADCRIVRLPALYGTGLRKNALYDLLHDNQVEKINPAGSFQWYPTARLWPDIERTVTFNLPLVNLFTEPLAMSAIVARCFPGVTVGPAREPALSYAVETCYAEIFGGVSDFIMSADMVLADIARFVASEQVSAI